MKKLILTLALALASAVSMADVTSASTISRTRTDFKQVHPLGTVLKAKHISLVDSANSGNLKVTVGREAKLKEYYPVVHTNLTSKYALYGGTVTGMYYKATFQNGDYVDMPLFSSPPNYGGNYAGKYNSYLIGPLTFVGYAPMVIEGVTVTGSSFLSDDKFSYYQYDQNLNPTVSVLTYRIMTMKGRKGQYYPEVTTNWVESVTGTGIYSDITTNNMPRITHEGRVDTVLPDDFMHPMPITEYKTRTSTITKESQLLNTNYLGGVVEWDFPANLYMTSDSYLKVNSSSMSDGTADIKFIYEK